MHSQSVLRTSPNVKVVHTCQYNLSTLYSPIIPDARSSVSPVDEDFSPAGMNALESLHNQLQILVSIHRCSYCCIRVCMKQIGFQAVFKLVCCVQAVLACVRLTSFVILLIHTHTHTLTHTHTRSNNSLSLRAQKYIQRKRSRCNS